MLNYPLLAWQEEAINFMARRKRAFCFDTVGVGKTIEALGVIQKLRKEQNCKKVLIVVKAATLFQWESEIIKFLPQPFKLILTSSYKNRAECYKHFSEIEDFSILILNYEKISIDYEALSKINCDIVICDEAAILSNDNNTSMYATWIIKRAKFAYGLTATPFSRNAEQIYNIFNNFGISLDTSLKSFNDKYNVYETKVIYKYNPFMRRSMPFKVKKSIGFKNFDILSKVIKEHSIRRTKDKLKEIYGEEFKKNLRRFYFQTYEINKEQKKLYTELKKKTVEYVRSGKTTEKEMQPLLRYKYFSQILDSPYVFTDTGSKDSPKLEGLVDLLDSFSGKVVVYSYFLKFCDMIQSRLEKEGYKSVVINGKISKEELNERIKTFREEQDVRFLVMNDVGRVGLNLQVADTLVFMDTPYVPSDIEQVIGRIDREGQSSMFINIYFMLMSHTIEHNILINNFKRIDASDNLFEENTELKLSLEQFIEEL